MASVFDAVSCLEGYHSLRCFAAEQRLGRPQEVWEGPKGTLLVPVPSPAKAANQGSGQVGMVTP